MLILAVLVGCTNENAAAPASPPANPSPPATKTSPAGKPAPVVLTYDPEVTMLASLSGTLANVNGCLGFAPRKTGAKGTVLIMPSGTTQVKSDPFQVKIRGKTYALGDTVEFEFGGGAVSELYPDSPLRQTAPESCLGGPFAYIG